MQNIEARLISPQGEEVLMFAGLCPDDDAVFLNFEDGAPGLIDCPPNLASTHAPSESFSAFSGVDPSGTWTLELVATEGGVEGVLTGWNLEICQSSVAVAEVASTQFQLFPNPTAGKFTVLLAGDSEITHVRISDITGRVLMEIEALQVGEFEVDLTTHPDGVYLIHAIGTVGVSTQKLVKSR